MALELYSILEQAREEDRAENFSAALMKYRLFLKHETGDAQAWADYAGLLYYLGRFEDSLQASSRALGIAPGLRPALINRAAALAGLDQLDEARKIYERLVALEPDNPEVILALQKFLYRTGDVAFIEPELLKVLDAEPNNVNALDLLISIYVIKNDHQKIKHYMEKLIDVRFKDEDEILWHRSALLLKLGEFKEGFKLYEHRESNRRKSVFDAPLWNGRPFPGQTLFLRWEQGFGDTIMMLRYGPMLKALGGDVILYVQDSLADIAKTCDGFDYIVTNKDKLPRFDFQLPLMSLPLALGTDLSNIPSETPYIKVPPIVKNKEAIINRLNQSDKKKKIGLIWAGNKLYKNDVLRSISPHLLAPFGQYQDATWHSFQRETPDLIPFDGMVLIADLMETFADTAFLVSSMDLVITVDTGVAHLAGALGKPVALMLSSRADWRWMLARQDSPWYPSMRIYRQSFDHNWGGVIDAVVRDLLNGSL